MITISTLDFVGLLSDVVPFASTDETLPALNGVRIEWDGSRLHAMSTDRYRIGWSQWDPDDDPDEDVQEDLFTQWGGADDGWRVTIPLNDAKGLVKSYKLPTKEAVSCPLSVEYDRLRLVVRRLSDSGYSALRMDIEGLPEPDAEDASPRFPDLRKLLSEMDVLQPTRSVHFSARLLADFAKVRQRGPLEFRFTGPKTLAHVSIGERFIGAIMPVRPGTDGSDDA